MLFKFDREFRVATDTKSYPTVYNKNINIYIPKITRFSRFIE